MRQARLKAPAHQPSGFYHCISRVVDGRFVLDDNEKEIFARLLRESEAFSQVHVLTYCVLSNHFHVLVEVPRRPDNPPSMDEIVGMLERLSGHQNLDAVRMQLDTFRRHKDAAAEKRLHARLRAARAKMEKGIARLRAARCRWTACARRMDFTPASHTPNLAGFRDFNRLIVAESSPCFP